MPAAPFRRAAERLERQRRLACLRETHGDLKAVLEPCERERAILASVAPWRVPKPAPRQRWTAALGPSTSAYDFIHTPEPIMAAIADAYRMPTTMAEAKAEFAYWETRNADIEAVLGEQGYDDFGLDLPALYRFWMVRADIESELELSTLQDIAERIRAYQADEGSADRSLDAIFRDILALADKEVR